MIVGTRPGGPGHQIGESSRACRGVSHPRVQSNATLGVNVGGGHPARKGAPEYNLTVSRKFFISHENDSKACNMVFLGMINMHIIMAASTG